MKRSRSQRRALGAALAGIVAGTTLAFGCGQAVEGRTGTATPTEANGCNGPNGCSGAAEATPHGDANACNGPNGCNGQADEEAGATS